MNILLLLIPLSALIVVGAIVVYLRAVDTGQFDDLERQGRITLFEETTAVEAGDRGQETAPTRRTP